MHIPRAKCIISAIIIASFFLTRFAAVSAASSNVHYKNGAYYASQGAVNCFPGKGVWSNMDQLRIEPHPETGDEYKPADMKNEFKVGWTMPLNGMKDQIKAGLKYRVSLDVFGHLLDPDRAWIMIDFLVKQEDGRGFATVHYFNEDVDGWDHKTFEGYIPQTATAMNIRLYSIKFTGLEGTGLFADDDAAIYFRNIEVNIIDDAVPLPTGVNFGSRYEFKEQEERFPKSYYGLGDKVYMDLLFNEPVFVNDSGYLEYARNLSTAGRSELADLIAAQYKYESGVSENVRNNAARTAASQFGDLRLEFKYRNSDGSVKTGYADIVGRSLLKEEPDDAHLKKIKFAYTIREGDEFRAGDIFDMKLVGGVITDNSYNMMPDDRRSLTFDSASTEKNIYRSYSQNFAVETTPPVLLNISGNVPEGMIDDVRLLGLYLKFSEPVYLIEPEGVGEADGVHPSPNLILNSQKVDQQGNVTADGITKAYYMDGNGSSKIHFNYMVRSSSVKIDNFDPLEVTGSVYTLTTADSGTREFGQVYVRDAAGNTAPLFQNISVKLSDKKYYAGGDIEPPQIAIQSRKSEDGNGFVLKVDVTDKGSGLNYDSVKFGFGGSSLDKYAILNKNKKLLVPGREYHSDELFELFGLEKTGSGVYRVSVTATDNNGNTEYGMDALVSLDNKGPKLLKSNIEADGSYTVQISDDYDGVKGVGLGDKPDVLYKWVMAGTDPEMVGWAQVNRAYNAGAGICYAEISRPSVYIRGETDLYIKAADIAGNSGVFSIPKAYKGIGDLDVSRLRLADQEGKAYKIYVQYKKGDYYIPATGVWYCMTRNPSMPALNDGIWKYKDGSVIYTHGDLGMEGTDKSGVWYLHVRAAGGNGSIVGAETVTEPFNFDFTAPEINVDANLLLANKWRLHVCATDNSTLPEDIYIRYMLNGAEWKTLDNDGVITFGSELQHNNISVVIEAIDQNNNKSTYKDVYYFNWSTEEGKLPEPYVYLSYGLPGMSYGGSYSGTAYTNEDFVELEVYTTADEFSYSMDGVNWSSWLPLTEKNYFRFMEQNRYYDLLNSKGYDVYSAYVPLPQMEGPITFYTRYRKGASIVSDPVSSTIIRDVTPPSASVNYSETTYTTIAELTGLKDNLCPAEAITAEGGGRHVFDLPGSHTFVIKDAAGNRTEIKASVTTVGSPPPETDTSMPVITINGTPDGSIVREVSAEVNASDNSPVTVKYAWSTDNNYGNIPDGGWIQTVSGSTLSLSGVTDGTWYLYVKAVDSSGNMSVANKTYILDATDPVISVTPNGSGSIISVSPEINVQDQYVTVKTYVWSQEVTPPASGWTAVPASGYVQSPSGVSGIRYLHVRAVDPAGNTGTFTSAPYNLVTEYTTPHVVYSGEPEGNMRAYLVSRDDITVTGPAVVTLVNNTPGDENTVTYNFNYSYSGGTTGTAVASYTYGAYYPGDVSMYKGNVTMAPVDSTTTGAVEFTVEAPAGGGYGGYAGDIEFWPEDGGLYEYMFSGGVNARAVILAGRVMNSGGTVARVITEGDPEYYAATVSSLTAGQYIEMYKVRFTAYQNGFLKYHVDDWVFKIIIGHIVEESEQGNVTIALAGLKMGMTVAAAGKGLTSAAAGYDAAVNSTLVAAAGSVKRSLYTGMLYALNGISGIKFPGGILLAYNTTSGGDSNILKAQITYTADDPVEGSVTSRIALPGAGGAKVLNNGGSSSYVFNGNGQFIFEYDDGLGNNRRALAEVGSFNTDIPQVDVLYSKLLPAKEAVRVTLIPALGVSFVSGDADLVSENGVYRFDAAENGSWNFTFKNTDGKLLNVTAKVDNIDKTPPKLRVVYLNDYDEGTVRAVLESDEPLRIPDGKAEQHIFTENGKYVFAAQDAAGNSANVTAEVSSLPFLQPGPSRIGIGVKYSTKLLTNKPVIISLSSKEPFTVINTFGKSEIEVTKNGVYRFLVQDELGLLKAVDATVSNIDTQAPEINLGFADGLTIQEGGSVNLKNFTASDNVDGDLTADVNIQGAVNTGEAGLYKVTYWVLDKAGNRTEKTVSVRVKGEGGQHVYINGAEIEQDTVILNASELKITAKGFMGRTSVKWAKGYKTAAYFKTGGTEADSGTVAVSAAGWITLYVYDSERNIRVIHVLINEVGGAQQ